MAHRIATYYHDTSGPTPGEARELVQRRRRAILDAAAKLSGFDCLDDFLARLHPDTGERPDGGSPRRRAGAC